MPFHAQAEVQTAAKVRSLPRLWPLAAGSLLALSAALAASQVMAEGETITSHGYSRWGTLGLPADFDHLPYVNPDAPKGGEYSQSVEGTFDTMNPYATMEGNSGALATIGFERLFQGTADEVSASYCYLCTTIEYPADPDERTWVIFNLRRDVTFSDGEPMTAEDIVFSHDLFIEQGTASFADVVGRMLPEVVALDDYTVKFTLGEGFSPDDAISQAGATVALPKHWYEETGLRLDEPSWEIAPGTGAYQLDSYKQNEQIIYRHVDNWWGEDIPFNRGRDNFETIRLEYFADTSAAFEGFKAGAFTFRQENSSLNWATAYEFPALEKGWVVREEVPDGGLPNATGFIFNMKSDKFADRRVRQALGLMFNFTWTNENLQYGLFQQRESFWQGSDFEAVGVPEGRELEMLQTVADLIDPSILTDEVTHVHTSGESQVDRGNLRQALDLMAEAGYTVGDDGIMKGPDGQPFTVEFLFYAPSFDRILIPYVDNLKTLGIEARYNRVDPAQYTERVRNFDYDMTFAGYSVGLEEGESLGQRFGTDGLGDVFNPAYYSNPAVDKLIPFVANATTEEEMAAGVRAIDRIMRYDHWMVPVWYLGKYWVAYYDFYRHPDTQPPYALGSIDWWWIDQDAQAALVAEGALR